MRAFVVLHYIAFNYGVTDKSDWSTRAGHMVHAHIHTYIHTYTHTRIYAYYQHFLRIFLFPKNYHPHHRIQSHISGNANLKGAVSEYGELVVSLVGVMQDKLASVRLLGEQAIASLLAKGYISKAIVDKAVRDLPPATLRGMQAAIDRIYSAAPTRSNSITSKANESASLAVSAPSVKAEAIAPTKSDARGEVAPPPPTAAKSRHHHTDEPPVSTTLKKSVSNDLTMSGIYENGGGGVANSSAGNVIKKTNKARRVEECARIKWPQPPEEPGTVLYDWVLFDACYVW